MLSKRKIKAAAQPEFMRIKTGIIVAVAAVMFALGGVCGWILSENFIISFFAATVVAPCGSYRIVKDMQKKKFRRVEEAFLEAMQLASASLGAGTSIEQTFEEMYEAYRCGTATNLAPIAQEINRINRRVKLNYSFYDELYAFAKRTGSGDIISCAEALKIAGIRGGNVVRILRNSTANLRVKLETDGEIRQTLSLPVYNQRIMTVMPFIIIAMIKGMSSGYMELLYGSGIGPAVAAAVGAVLVLAWIIGEKITEIEV